MTEQDRQRICEKAREFGRVVASADVNGLPPIELLGLCQMCQAIDTFLAVFEKGLK